MEIVIEIANGWSNLSMYWTYNRGSLFQQLEEKKKKKKAFKQVGLGKEQKKASFIIVSVAKDV
jgi:hypothetical protein